MFQKIKYLVSCLIVLVLLGSCMADDEYYKHQEELKELEEEEKSDFEKILDLNFDKGELPLKTAMTFDDYNPQEYLSEKEFDLLYLDYVFPEGYEPRKYSAGQQLHPEKDYQMITVYFEDSDQELSTYLVTYDLEGYFISQVRVAYDEIAEGFLQIYSTISGDTITRTTAIHLDETMLEKEYYFIQEDGEIIWEQDMPKMQ